MSRWNHSRKQIFLSTINWSLSLLKKETTKSDTGKRLIKFYRHIIKQCAAFLDALVTHQRPENIMIST